MRRVDHGFGIGLMLIMGWVVVWILMVPTISNAKGFFDFKSVDTEEETTEKCEQPTVCHYSIQVADTNGAKVYYIFKAFCGGIIQVGIVDEPSKLVMELDRLKVVSETKYFGTNKRNDLIKKNWGNLFPVPFYEKK